jgi:hypothetical protein
LRVAQGDLVGLGYVVGLDRSQSLAQALASLPQQLKGIGGGTLRGAALRVSSVFLDEVGLQGCGDFVGRLQRVVDGPVSCCVVNHAASIAPLVRLGPRAPHRFDDPVIIPGNRVTHLRYAVRRTAPGS